MSETRDVTEDRLLWIAGLTLLPDNAVVRPAGMSYVTPNEYRVAAESLLRELVEANAELRAALATAHAEAAP